MTHILPNPDGLMIKYEADGSPSVAIESSRIDICLNYILRNNIKSIYAAPCFGFKEESLDFLNKINEIEDIWIWDADIKDANGLYCLNKLQKFGISKRHCGIQFDKLQDLRNATIVYNKGDTGIDKTRIQDLHLWHYGKGANVVVPKTVQTLTINHASIRDICDLPILDNLRHLELHYCRNLDSIKGVKRIAPRLEFLLVGNSKKIPENEWNVNYGIAHQCINHCITKGVV